LRLSPRQIIAAIQQQRDTPGALAALMTTVAK